MKINYEDTITLVALATALIMTIYLEQKDLASVIVGVLGGYIGATGGVKRSQYMKEQEVKKEDTGC
ncbi:MAG: hypothetical protein ACLSXY_00215 [Veillonella sp.]|jgi:hypothetical protein|nr:MAG: hypothetical protein D8B58_12835 [Veillonella sp.]DAQ54424.1 MAG TPA: hypothetical protein [Caudoviricetes sp.]DAX95101.1 MAG TPA: hypothetical protein [Caudoviricetes sp.]